MFKRPRTVKIGYCYLLLYKKIQKSVWSVSNYSENDSKKEVRCTLPVVRKWSTPCRWGIGGSLKAKQQSRVNHNQSQHPSSSNFQSYKNQNHIHQPAVRTFRVSQLWIHWVVRREIKNNIACSHVSRAGILIRVRVSFYQILLFFAVFFR